MSIKEAWELSRGPQSKKDKFFLYLKGFCMGTADVIPGVSGGTIAFVTGIYDDLLAAITSIDKNAIMQLLRFNFSEVLKTVHAKFLIFLGLGVVTAILSTARLMHYLITDHPVPTWSLFFGLIAASILHIGKEVEDRYKAKNMISLIAGIIIAYTIVSLIPVSTPEEPWFIILCGMIGITAMILPGISGSFLLLILGKYEYITSAVKNPVNSENITILLIFLIGTISGLMGFSRILKFFITKYRSISLSLLTGFMIGAMKKVWPWKEVLETKVVRGKTHVLREANILPNDFNGEFWLSIALCIFGFLAVMAFDKYAGQKSKS